jgi:chorismate dehydratase
MSKIKISAVSYLNSKPFIYGLEHSAIIYDIDLQLDIPSVCAAKLLENKVDIGLVPVAVLPEMDEYHIISDYCIGADGEVGSVLLLSEVPLNDIRTVLLDYQSRTSVELVQVLANKYWKIQPAWQDAEKDYETRIGGTTAGVVIGDRTFPLKNKHKYCYDLAGEWKKFTTLPFVFACWVSNKELDDSFTEPFNAALKKGLESKSEVIKQYTKSHKTDFDIKDYLENKLDFILDEKKREALKLFLSYVEEEAENEVMKII